MSDEGLIRLDEEGIEFNIADEKLAKGQWVTYMCDEYPGKIVREYPNGRLESIDIDEESDEIIILEVLKQGSDK
jgi:hypothetical protein